MVLIVPDARRRPKTSSMHCFLAAKQRRFGCPWECGIIIEKLLLVDRSGSVLIQDIIRQEGASTYLKHVGLPELLLTACWFIWWQRRRMVHGEEIQTAAQSALSIEVIATNYSLRNGIRSRLG